MPITPGAWTLGGEPQPSSLIVSLYGLYARVEPHWLSVASLVRMMAPLGVNGPAVRATVSRLKRRGTLVNSRRDGAAGYAPSAGTLQALREGDLRIFGRRRAVLEDGWVLLTFSVPETERGRRHELRSRLTRLGFGTVASGVWIAPAQLATEAHEMLLRRGLESYVEMFTDSHFAFAEVRQSVAKWWDLEVIAAENAHFIDRYRPLAGTWRRAMATDEQAFAEYIPMLTTWRRLPYLDPGIPPEVLPPGWNGLLAENLFGELNDLLAEPARRYAFDHVRQA